MSKFISMEEAVAKVESGMTIMMGGFLGVGSPNSLVEALLKTDVKDLTVITNDTAFAHIGVGKLIAEHRVV
ncbi:MAG TPA: CoA-transferase, partial [Bacteroidales bacterium]|nr:CoA-transferase [Bacteroidales bacterium]